MPLTVKVGLSRKTNLRNGRLIAFCHVEVEIDIADFDHTVQEAYSACGHAIVGILCTASIR